MGIWSQFASLLPLRLLASGTPEPGSVPVVDPTGRFTSFGPFVGAAREPSGVLDRTESTISVDDGTRTLTLTPVGASFDYYASGEKVTISTPQTCVWTDVDGLHFIYFSGGVLTHSTTPWSLDDPAIVPIAALLWDATANKSIPLEERHGLIMDRATHRYLHRTHGTRLVSGGAITSGTYAVAGAAPSNADNSFGVDQTIIADEDIESTLAALTDGSAIGRLWRDGASGVWRWDTSTVFPKVGATGTYIAKNVLSGTWQLVDLAPNNFVSWWLVAIPVVGSTYRFALVIGQVEHATLAAAQAETVAGLAWGALPFTEAVGLARIIYKTGAGYASTGKCRIEEVTRLVYEGLNR